MKSVLTEKVIADYFPKATEFSETFSMLWIGNREIQKLQCTVKAALELLFITFFLGFQCPPDFASHVCQLHSQRECLPPTPC